MLASASITKVGHDLKRAVLALRGGGVRLAGPLFDTMVAAYCVDPSGPGLDLETQVIERFGHGLRRAPSEATADELAAALGERADLALQLADRLDADLAAAGQESLFARVEMPLVRVLADMEWSGIAIDPAVFATLSRRLAHDLERLRAIIVAEAGAAFNPDSPVQLRQVLFERLGLPIIKRTKTGASTDAAVLAELAARGYAVPRYLLEYRQLAKLKSTYADALPAHAAPDGRIHTTFNQAVTATGRLSSSEPNLQNIPVRSELGATLRRGFVSPPDHLLLSADYSQIELRVVAHLAGEPAFLAAFGSGGDIHRETAARVFGVAASEVSEHMRGIAKVVNFATIYGQRAPALARLLGIGVERGAELHQRLLRPLPGCACPARPPIPTGPRARLRRDPARPAALRAGAALARPPPARLRRAGGTATRPSRARPPTSSSWP